MIKIILIIQIRCSTFHTTQALYYIQQILEFQCLRFYRKVSSSFHFFLHGIKSHGTSTQHKSTLSNGREDL